MQNYYQTSNQKSQFIHDVLFKITQTSIAIFMATVKFIRSAIFGALGK